MSNNNAPSSGGGAAPGGTTTTSSNPFDFDVDFDKVAKRREQYLARKAAERGETLLQGMDADGDGPDGDNNNNNATTNNNDGSGGDGGGQGQALRQMTRGLQFLMTKGNNAAANIRVSGINVGGIAGIGDNTSNLEPGVVGVFGGKKVMRWPYDDYHVVQQQYYMKLDELEQQQRQDGNNEEKDSTVSSLSGIGSSGVGVGVTGLGSFMQGIGGVGRTGKNASGSSTGSTKTTATLQRPADPPDIPTAVLGLPLSDFESKAEERAIAIVSTWLFDCGLIDELLIHGGMGKSTMQAVKTSDVSNTAANSITHASHNDSSSVPSQEGIEIGTYGHVIEGPSKMDKEIAKLRGGTARQLALVNARLNDGVAASGGEVQELVNAVNSTKDDLGRLRELSTYISITGDAQQSARSQTFMLTRYPKLKKAINARRNLARCFRELDFYSQIPLTCDRLREELHEAEWTESEWSSLREVSREHVELEIFLVEAEAGMKKRIDEEAAENQRESNNAIGGGGGMGASDNRRSSLMSGAGGQQNRSSSLYMGNGLPHNYDEVDTFLHEHVKNVWELGDEIRLRIMSGIGGAFELAMNNPAGLVALVEAVEVYETANEEYKTVHGMEAGLNQNLRFTDMRASALKQMYQDFELRGLEVFREVHEVVSNVFHRLNWTTDCGHIFGTWCLSVFVRRHPHTSSSSFDPLILPFRYISPRRLKKMVPMKTMRRRMSTLMLYYGPVTA